MALNLTPIADFNVEDYIVEPFGVKGLAELTLRAMLQSGTVTLAFPYTSAAAQSLRNAGRKIADTTGETFTFEKAGKTYREVSYPVTRTLKDGTVKTVEITRQFLNTEAIVVTNVRAEADAAIAADTDK